MPNSTYTTRVAALHQALHDVSKLADPVTKPAAWRAIRRQTSERFLLDALHVAYDHLELADQRTVDWLMDNDADTVARIAALLDLAYAAGWDDAVGAEYQ
jgi:hypothetical protein